MRPRILQTPGIKDPSRLPFNDRQGVEAGYQSGASTPNSKGAADPIYAHVSA
jgi:hypothetical protein